MKYKWIILFSVITLILTTSTGCKKKEEQKEKTEEEKLAELLYDEDGADVYRVYFNSMDGSDYIVKYVDFATRVTKPIDPVRDGYSFSGWYVDKACTEKFDFTNIIIQSIMLYAKWEEYVGVDYSFLLDEYVPDRISSNIQLPTTIEDYPDIFVTWQTSDENTLDMYGNVIQGREEIKVTVTMNVVSSKKVSYKKDVIVEPIEFIPMSARTNRAMFGYYSYWNFTGYTEDQLKLDVINASFAYVNADLSVDYRSINSYIPKILVARKSGVRVVISIQGAEANSGNFSTAAKTEENRKLFAKNVVDFVEKFHFDGVDIDWEYPGWSMPTSKHFEAENYTLLIKELNEQLKAKNPDYIVSAAIPGGSEGWQRYDLDQVAPYLDYIHLMTYDLEASTKIFHHTALYGTNGRATGNMASVNDSVQLFELKGVPASKLVPGIAFYGKTANPSTATNGGLGSNSANNNKYVTMTYTNIYNNYITKIDNKNIIYYFDKECQAPYIYDVKNNLFITYDDETSIKAKCNYARGMDREEETRLGGVMIWEIGEDRTGNLMKAVLSGMKRA